MKPRCLACGHTERNHQKDRYSEADYCRVRSCNCSCYEDRAQFRPGINTVSYSTPTGVSDQYDWSQETSSILDRVFKEPPSLDGVHMASFKGLSVSINANKNNAVVTVLLPADSTSTLNLDDLVYWARTEIGPKARSPGYPVMIRANVFTRKGLN